ncbi:MAG: class I SAM-dependent methyltransferase [Oligoflexia bacterium]|nr:class I SAM-dependent methyltransferase [Oligoflexia bacterium]
MNQEQHIEATPSIESSDYKRGGLQKNVYSSHETTTWNCPLCGHHDDTVIKYERGTLGVVECRHCSLIRINPRLINPDAIYHGQEKDYNEEFRLIVSGKQSHHRDKNYREDLNTIRKYKPRGEFLDIGTNVGSFLRLARDQQWNLTGIEPSQSLNKLAREWWGLNIINNFLEKANLPEKYFDIVTMTDVFEHIINPDEVLQAILKIIKKDGVLFIKVPNGKFNVYKHAIRKKFLGRENADDFDSYEHVCHYSDITLRKMIEKNGYKVIETKIALPVQLPVWHKYVGQYYQYPSPFFLDWKTYLGRSTLYHLSKIERLILGGQIGHLAPNIICIARPN